MSRQLDGLEPPTPEYRQVGWHCVYHEQQRRSCHNPLDCDLVPVWALAVDEAYRVGFVRPPTTKESP